MFLEVGNSGGDHILYRFETVLLLALNGKDDKDQHENIHLYCFYTITLELTSYLSLFISILKVKPL